MDLEQIVMLIDILRDHLKIKDIIIAEQDVKIGALEKALSERDSDRARHTLTV